MKRGIRREGCPILFAFFAKRVGLSGFANYRTEIGKRKGGAPIFSN